MKNIKTSTIILVATFFISGCYPQRNEELEKKSIYNNLIFNTVLSYPYYHYTGAPYSGGKNQYEGDKLDILQKIKVVKDDSLGIALALHSWTDVGGDFPKKIISIESGDSILFAFPFYDEYFHHLHPCLIADETRKEEVLKHANLKLQISHFFSEMKWLSIKERPQVNKFITLLADSLLGLKEYNTSDTTILRKEILNDLEFADEMDICNKALNQNIQSLITDASQNDVRIFNTTVGTYGFWKFSIKSYMHSLYVDVSFENCECYLVVLL